MARRLRNWIEAYLNYTEFSESPRRFHFWTAVSTIAAALQRRVWIDMHYFEWVPNFYIILVAPPGVAKKSSTIDIGVQLLKEAEACKFGAASITWQALITSLREAQQYFEYQGEQHPQAPIHVVASELGMFFNPHDRELVDLLTHMWDGRRETFRKSTKTMGDEVIHNPCMNLIGATTPAWLEQHLTEHFVTGGLASRCIFVYAKKPRHLVAYPHLVVPPEFQDLRAALTEDLRRIAELVGKMELSKEALEWGQKWYERHYSQNALLMEGKLGGYFARKQTHIHKLAMILSVAERDDLVITEHHLQVAERHITALEPTLMRIFDKVGASDFGRYLYEFVFLVESAEKVEFNEAYAYMSKFVSVEDFQKIVAAATRMGRIRVTSNGAQTIIRAVKEDGAGEE